MNADNHTDVLIKNDIRYRGVPKDIALLSAIFENCLEKVALTLTNGANVNASVLTDYVGDDHDPNPEFSSICNHAYENADNNPAGLTVFKSLIDKGMDISGKNMLESAAWNADSIDNIQRFKTVLDVYKRKGLDINETDKFNNTPLNNLCFNLGYSDIQKETEQCIFSLLRAGADPNIPDKMGKTPLMKAVDTKNPYAVKRLLEYGAKVSPHDCDGKTALSFIDFKTAEGLEISEMLKKAVEREKRSNLRETQQTHTNTNDTSSITITNTALQNKLTR